MENHLMNLYDGGIKEIADKRRFCFGSDGVQRPRDIIAGRQIGKACGSAEYRRVKSLGPKIPLRTVYADRRDARDGFENFKGMSAFKSGRGHG